MIDARKERKTSDSDERETIEPQSDYSTHSTPEREVMPDNDQSNAINAS